MLRSTKSFLDKCQKCGNIVPRISPCLEYKNSRVLNQFFCCESLKYDAIFLGVNCAIVLGYVTFFPPFSGSDSCFGVNITSETINKIL